MNMYIQTQISELKYNLIDITTLNHMLNNKYDSYTKKI